MPQKHFEGGKFCQISVCCLVILSSTYKLSNKTFELEVSDSIFYYKIEFNSVFEVKFDTVSFANLFSMWTSGLTGILFSFVLFRMLAGNNGQKQVPLKLCLLNPRDMKTHLSSYQTSQTYICLHHDVA